MFNGGCVERHRLFQVSAFLLCAPNADVVLLFRDRVHQVLPALRVQSVSLAQL